jgi:hypothetical protein
VFTGLVDNLLFQEQFCKDEEHRNHLHQAVFSAVVTRHTLCERIRALPASYGSGSSDDAPYFLFYEPDANLENLPCLKNRPEQKAWLVEEMSRSFS